MVKAPKVIILRGKVIVFNIGFTNVLSNPRDMPKSRIICHSAVKLTPKKFESGNNSIDTPFIKEDAIHSPKVAAAI